MLRTLTAAAAVLALLLPACNRGAQVAAPEPSDATDATAAPTPSAPAATATAAPSASPTSSGGQTVQLFFVRESGERTFVEPEAHRLSAPTVGVARAAVTALLDATPAQPALRNLLPDGTRLLDVELDEGTLTIDLDFPGQGVPYGAGFESFTYRQLVETGAQFPSVRRVRILEQGAPPASGHLDLSRPMRPDDLSWSPIIITSPAHDEEVAAGDVTVTGTANVYEANVGLRLVDPDGEVVEETFTTATCGTGCRGDWSHTFTVTTPGTWTVVAREDDASDGEGFEPFVTRRWFTVR